MNSEILLERDMLYPTDNRNMPGSINVRIYSPVVNSRIPAVIESKTYHSPLKYMDAIIRVMQVDIFDRIFVDIMKSVDIYIKADAEASREYGGKAYIKVFYNGENLEYVGVDNIE